MRNGIQTAFRVIVVAAAASGAAAKGPSAETFLPTGEVWITPPSYTLQWPEVPRHVGKAEPTVAQNCMLREVEASGNEALLPPLVDHIGARATLLYWGMPVADVERIMGMPAQVEVAGGEGSSVRILKYPAGPIGTTVTITDDKLSGVALDIAGIDDRTLPTFSRVAWLGMSRTSVLRMLGTPTEDHLRDGYGMTVEQMVFRRPCEPDVSIFLIDGRVVSKKVGRSFPSNLLAFTLPLAPDPGDNEIDDVADWPKERRVAVGMKESEVQELLGAPKLHVDYTFKGRPAEYAIYETSPGQSFGRFTFIDGVLTEFVDGGATPLNQILGH
jgi:hypothetical protein